MSGGSTDNEDERDAGDPDKGLAAKFSGVLGTKRASVSVRSCPLKLSKGRLKGAAVPNAPEDAILVHSTHGIAAEEIDAIATLTVDTDLEVLHGPEAGQIFSAMAVGTARSERKCLQFTQRDPGMVAAGVVVNLVAMDVTPVDIVEEFQFPVRTFPESCLGFFQVGKPWIRRIDCGFQGIVEGLAKEFSGGTCDVLGLLLGVGGLFLRFDF
jgi:hypothetical protein